MNMTDAVKRITSFIERHEVLILILLLVAVLRLPSLLEPYWYGDEGIYLVLGQALKNGLVWYRDIHDNKPPLLYLLAAVSGSVMYFRLLLMFWNIATVTVVWRLSQLLLKKQSLVIIATTLFALASTLPTLEGNIANAEIFMILPTALAVLILLKASNYWHYAVSGLLFSCSFLFKVPAAFDFAGVFIWLLLFGGLNWKKGVKHSLIALTSLVVGFLVPIILSLVYYFAMGAGIEYLNAAFLQNIGYLSSWKTGSISKSGASTQSGLASRGIILLITTGAIWIVTRKLKPNLRLLPVWFGWALFGALLSERPYPHYLIQILVPASLLLTVAINSRKKSLIAVTGGLAALTIGAIFKYQFYFYPIGQYYLNFANYVSGQMPLAEYRNTFDWRVERNYQLAYYLKLHSQPEDKLFIWGDEPFIYALTNRRPVGRYSVAYHVIDFGGKEETMDQLRNNPPLYIILETSEKREFKELFAFTSVNYIPVKTIEDATIFRRIN
jgi:hypothetical protein